MSARPSIRPSLYSTLALIACSISLALARRPCRSLSSCVPWGFVRPSLGGEGGRMMRQRGFTRSICVPSSSPLKVSYTGATPAPSFVPYNNLSSASTVGGPSLSLREAPLPPSQPARPPPTPRPVNLPGLSKEDLILLRAGQRVQHQIRNGCMGSGYAVIDVMAPSQKVWDTLLNFERYAEMVPTIRGVSIKSRIRNFTKGIFTLSKFRFRLSVIHKHRPEESRLDFYLDPDAHQYKGILEMAEGFWFIDERPSDRPEGWTRVYMQGTVKVNSLVPMWLVEYAAERALKRATSWLKPWVEQGR